MEPELDEFQREWQRKKRIDTFKLAFFIAVIFGLFVFMCWVGNLLVDHYGYECGSL